jgi:hypothetical protein
LALKQKEIKKVAHAVFLPENVIIATLNPRNFLKFMSSKIEPGQSYLLDGKTIVKVLKPINRSLTMFNIEVSDRGVESVEASRLLPLDVNLLVKK